MNKLIWCSCLLLYAATIGADNNDLAEFRVLTIKFRGIKSISRKKLSRHLMVESSPRWKFWQQVQYITLADVEDDVQQIKQFYQNAGYFHAEISYNLEVVTKHKIVSLQHDTPQDASNEIKPTSTEIPAVRLTYSINEGPPVTVKSTAFAITPETEAVSEDALIDLIPLKKGEIFAITSYRESKKIITKVFRNRGYPHVDVIGAVKVNTDRNEATATFEISPGLRCQFGHTNITGNHEYVRKKIFLRALRYKQSDIYSQEKIDESLRNLFNLDVFKTVSLSPREGDSEDTIIPMMLDVAPKKRQSVSLGLGYGSEDGPRASGKWTYRNAFNWAGKFSINAKGSDLIRKADLEYVQPYAFGPKSTVRYDSGYEREILESHTNRKLFTDIDFNQKLQKNWAWNLGYSLEKNDLEDLNIDDPEELARFNQDNDFLISSFAFGVTRDSRDSLLNPTRGSVLTLALEHGSELTGSEVDFFAPSFEVIHHLQFANSFSLGGRFRVDSIEDIQDTESIPVFKRLFVGGGATVRGYGFQKLGPIDIDGDPVGGQSSFYANMELRYPLYKKLSGVAFLDMGLVDEESFTYNPEDILYSCGLGARYQTVIGHIRLDFGYKLNPPKRGDFGITTDPDEEIEDRWKIHINIGHAF